MAMVPGWTDGEGRLMEKLRWLPATAAHVQKIESAVANSILGSTFGSRQPGDNVRLVLRGDSPPSTDLSHGRPEGGVPTDVVAHWFAEFLNEDQHALVLLEDLVHSRSDPAVLRRDRSVWCFPAGVAWPIFGRETADDASRALAMLRGGPLFYGFYRLPSGWTLPDDGAELRDADLAVLHAHLVAVMTDVYDWDGLLLWERGDRVASRFGVDVRPDRR